LIVSFGVRMDAFRLRNAFRNRIVVAIVIARNA
jgi:hypothetical protein